MSAVAADVGSAIFVGDENGAVAVDVPVIIPGVVEGRHGYRRPLGHHRHCPGTAAAGWRWPSGGSSATTDRAAVVGRLGFGLG